MSTAANLRRQKRQATIIKTKTDEVIDQIGTLQNVMCNKDIKSYSANREAVQTAVNDQKKQTEEIEQLSVHVKEACEDDESTGKEIQKVESAYNDLKKVSEKRTSCLDTVAQISSLQEFCVNLSKEFDSKAAALVDIGNKSSTGDERIGFFNANLSQSYIFALKDNWQWLTQLVNCMDVHLTNAAEYQQFFSEVDGNTTWLEDDLKKIYDTLPLGTKDGDSDGGVQLLQKTQELVLTLKQWEMRTNRLWNRANEVVPIHLRISGITNPVPVRALVDYNTPDFSVKTGEDLVLLDNENEQLWQVKNIKGEKGTVPALAVLIPGPFKEAIEAVVVLRLKLLAAWTNSLKVVGRRIILYTLMVLKSTYDKDEIMLMKSIEIMERQDKVKILDYIENTLKPHWGEHKGFKILQERMLMVRMNLEGTKVIPTQDGGKYKAMVTQITTLEQLVGIYEGIWQDWEKYKTVIEFSRYPELMLVVEKWEQLKFVELDKWAKFWQHSLTFSDDEMTLLRLEEELIGNRLDSTDYESDESLEIVPKEQIMELMTEENTPKPESDDFLHMEGEVDEFGYHEVEVQRKYVITSVMDTKSGQEISLNDAIDSGIVKQEEGTYKNLKTGELIPIIGAMTEGLIKVATKTSKKSKEKKSSIGIITVKSRKIPERPFVIKTVKDTLSNEDVSPEEGIKRNILNQQQMFYTDLKSKDHYTISDAAKQDLAVIEYTAPPPKEEIHSNTYEVRLVKYHKKDIPFDKAIANGVIDKEAGLYKDTSQPNNKWIKVDEAIKGGFMKARMIETKQLDSAQRNVLVRAKRNVTPLSVINAMSNRESFMSPNI